MRVLFFTWGSILRRYTGVVTELAAGGHEVVIASPSHVHRRLRKELRGLPRVRTVAYEEVADPAFGRAIALLRQTRDYAWYLSPAHRVASFNRRSALGRLVRIATNGAMNADDTWPDPIVELETSELQAVDGALAELDSQIPPDPGVVAFIRDHRPQVVLVSPLVKQHFHQAEVVKAARSLGVPTGFLVYSWDNLSNKGRVHAYPDRTFVWNELQRSEAVELHGIDPGSVVVTGAPHWDSFFSMQPSSTRAEFCLEHGFDPEQPIVLYLGSTVRVCPDETVVLDHWLDAVRRAGGGLAEANILFRPHPDRPLRERWSSASRRGGRVSVSPNPSQADQRLYDELHHASVAVGLNTTAQIEASILGRPVYTFAAGELAPGQEGTLHFYYLLKDRGGVVTYAETLDEHTDQLNRGITGDYDRDAIRRFCETFVRPSGLSRPVVPLLVEELTKLARPGWRTRLRLGRRRIGTQGRSRARAALGASG
jgi:hypothetical protein